MSETTRIRSYPAGALPAGTAAACPVPRSSVPSLFAEQLRNDSGASAIVDEAGTLTYASLDRWSDACAAVLLNSGSVRGEVIAVHAPRSRAGVAAYLGILKAGGTYLPMHPGLPADRKRGMLKDAGVTRVFRDFARENDRDPDWSGDAQLLDIPAVADSITPVKTKPSLDADDGAYLLYTSGSTGAPKGILVPHAGIERLLKRPNYFTPGPRTRMAHAASIAFDVSVFEIWGALLNGGCLVIVPENIAREPRAFARYIQEHAVNTMMLPPALLRQIAGVVPDAFAGIDDLFYAGEPAAPDFVADLLAGPGPGRLINGYGLTEISVLSTWQEIKSCDGRTPIPIGGPISGSRLYVLDEDLRPIHLPGPAGELYIGGIGLAHGYAGQAGLTADRFLPDPFDTPGSRMYRSGDLVRWNEQGGLDYIGRADRQIKLRGLRIEPGEIEVCLAAHPAVDRAAVRAYGENNERIGAWIIPDSDQRPASEVARIEFAGVLRKHVAKHLPEYMIPAGVFLEETLPLSPNGKVDYKALRAHAPSTEPVDSSAASPAASRRPGNAAEALLVWLMGEVLGRDVGADQGFLESGGDSLAAINLVNRIRQELGVETSLKQIFLGNTPAGIARELGWEGIPRPTASSQEAKLTARSPADPDEPAPLTPSQRRVWFLERSGQGRAYHVPLAFRLSCKDGEETSVLRTLDAAWQDLILRQAILRTVFFEENGHPLQRVVAAASARPDLVFAPEEVSADERDERIQRLCDTPFDLETRGGLRVRLLREKPKELLMLIVMHHIVEDGHSVGVLLRELGELFAARMTEAGPAPLPASTVRYVDFARELAAQPESHEAALQERIERLRGAGPLESPADRARKPRADQSGDEIHFSLGAAGSLRLREFCKAHDLTVFMALQALFWLWLWRLKGYSSEEVSILTGTQSTGQRTATTQDTIGFFADVQLLRADLSAGMSFFELLNQARSETLAILDSNRVDYAGLVEALRSGGTASTGVLFNQAYFHQEAQAMDPRLELAGLAVRSLELPWRTVRMDLELHTYERDDEFHVRCIYSTALYDRRTVENQLEIYRNLFAHAFEQPHTKLACLRAWSPARGETFLRQVNDRTDRYPDRPLASIFEDWAKRAPRAPAIIEADRTISYGELDDDARRIAARLKNAGLSRGATIAVRMHRSADLIRIWLATLKAGFVYLPLDPDAPAEREAAILEDARPALVIRRMEDVPKASSSSLRATPAGPDDPVYIMYTSGSTGSPRGVLVHGRGIARLVFGNDYAELEPGDRSAFVSHVSFDAVTFEVWAALLRGAAVVVFSAAEVLDPEAFARKLKSRRVTTLFQTTALFYRNLEGSEDCYSSLRRLLVGGEFMNPRAMERLLAHNGPDRVWHVYGPTECVTFAASATISTVPAGALSIPIGGPIAGSRCYILDEFLEPVAPGIPGELYIGGAGVAFGYLQNAARTAERFLPDPWGEEGSRMYRTGDRVRWTVDGQIDFVGRVDRQMKVRGFRIEPGEIETVLAGHNAVQGAIVQLRQDANGAKEIHAHVAHGENHLEEADLRAYLAAKLPAYMIPARLFLYPSFPLGPTGKTRLPEPDTIPIPPITSTQNTPAAPAPREAADSFESASEIGTTPPRNDLGREEALSRVRAIWRELLEHDGFQDDRHFFEVGGHSLLLLNLLHRLRELEPNFELGDLFEHSSVRAQADWIISRTRSSGVPRVERISEIHSDIHSKEIPEGPSHSVSASRLNDNQAGSASETALMDFAIIGMSGRFPGARDLEEFRANLFAGRETITRFSRDELRDHVPAHLLDDSDYVLAGGVLEDLESFDAEFFGISERDARLLPAEDRIILTETYRALVEAGYDPGKVTDRIGLFAGADPNVFSARRLLSTYTTGGIDYQMLNSGRAEFMASRVAYRLNLTGPVVYLQTACSTALVAVHQATQAIARGECEMALAGAVSLLLPRMGHLHQAGGIFSSDGHCRAFDVRADGMVQSSGAGVVLIKPLDRARRDGDPIQAVIRGSAVTNDGNDKIGFSAPSSSAQESLLRLALERARLQPEDIGYIETHGTGTRLGDMVEVRALRRVFGEERDLTIGAVKTNIGHASVAAGMAGLFKTIFALRAGSIPPTLHFESPNPEIFGSSRLRVNSKRTAWPDGGKRRAGVSAFGLGGTNAHVILEAANVSPDASDQAAAPDPRAAHYLVYSANDRDSLKKLGHDLALRLENDDDLSLADMAWTLATRPRLAHRALAVAADRSQALGVLRAEHPDVVDVGIEKSGSPLVSADRTAPSLPGSDDLVGPVFVLPGLNGFRTGAGRELYYREPVFRAEVDSLRSTIGLEAEELFNLSMSDDRCQAALMIYEYSLARTLMHWGVRPAALLGHSLGEIVAAAIAGVFDPREILPLLVKREHWMRTRMNSGARMLTVFQESENLSLPPELTVSTAAPGATVVCGAPAALESFARDLERREIQTRMVNVEHAAHSPDTAGFLDDFRGELQLLRLAPARIPLLSNLTGDFLDPSRARDVDYWIEQTRSPVLLKKCISALFARDARFFLEIGPGRSMAAFLRAHENWRGRRVFGILPRPNESGESESCLHFFGNIDRHDLGLDPNAYFAGARRRRIALPTAALPGRKIEFALPDPPEGANIDRRTSPPGPAKDSERDSGPASSGNETKAASPAGSIERGLAKIWREALFVDAVLPDADFFQLGGDSLMAVNLVTRIRDRLGVKLSPADLLRHPRFHQLVALLNQRADPNETTATQTENPAIVDTLKANGSGAPLYLIRPLDVSPLCYISLARELDRPVHVFTEPEIPEEQASIKRLAGVYLRRLRVAQPEGPYLIGGWSLGGMIAFEVARLLEEAGDVASLVLLDSSLTPEIESAFSHSLALQKAVLEIPLTMRPGELVRFSISSIKNTLSGLKALVRGDNETRTGEVLGRLAYSLPLFQLLTGPSRRRLDGLLNYVPTPIGQKTILVQARRLSGRARRRQRANLERLLEKEPLVLNASGNHMTFLWPDYVVSFADRLDEALEQSMRRK